ncbi:MAG: terminase small subunit [Desulfuromonadales bacterium]
MSEKPKGHTAQATLLNGSPTAVSGQAVLPDMQSEIGYDSAELEPWKERFCWEYVENGGVGYKAYLVAKPKVQDNTARVEASKLLTSPNIVARIAAIRKELRERYAVTADDLLEHHGRVLKIDRRRYFKENGTRIPIHELDHELASIVDLDSTFSKEYGIVMLPVVASREKSKEAMARILGLDKASTTVTHRFSEMSDEELEAEADRLATERIAKKQAKE